MKKLLMATCALFMFEAVAQAQLKDLDKKIQKLIRKKQIVPQD